MITLFFLLSRGKEKKDSIPFVIKGLMLPFLHFVYNTRKKQSRLVFHFIRIIDV